MLPIPFITRLKAKAVIENYLQEKNLEIKYTFPNNIYYTEKNGHTIAYYHYDKKIFDDRMSSKENREINKKYLKFLKNEKNKIFPNDVDVFTTIDHKDFSKKYYKIYVLSVHENKRFNNEDSIKNRMVELVLKLVNFMSDEFNITGIQFNYNCLDGEYRMAISGNKPLIKMSKNSLLNKIEKIDYFN